MLGLPSADAQGRQVASNVKVPAKISCQYARDLGPWVHWTPVPIWTRELPNLREVEDQNNMLPPLPFLKIPSELQLVDERKLPQFPLEPEFQPVDERKSPRDA